MRAQRLRYKLERQLDILLVLNLWIPLLSFYNFLFILCPLTNSKKYSFLLSLSLSGQWKPFHKVIYKFCLFQTHSNTYLFCISFLESFPKHEILFLISLSLILFPSFFLSCTHNCSLISFLSLCLSVCLFLSLSVRGHHDPGRCLCCIQRQSQCERKSIIQPTEHRNT